MKMTKLAAARVAAIPDLAATSEKSLVRGVLAGQVTACAANGFFPGKRITGVTLPGITFPLEHMIDGMARAYGLPTTEFSCAEYNVDVYTSALAHKPMCASLYHGDVSDVVFDTLRLSSYGTVVGRMPIQDDLVALNRHRLIWYDFCGQPTQQRVDLLLRTLSTLSSPDAIGTLVYVTFSIMPYENYTPHATLQGILSNQCHDRLIGIVGGLAGTKHRKLIFDVRYPGGGASRGTQMYTLGWAVGGDSALWPCYVAQNMHMYSRTIYDDTGMRDTTASCYKQNLRNHARKVRLNNDHQVRRQKCKSK